MWARMTCSSMYLQVLDATIHGQYLYCLPEGTIPGPLGVFVLPCRIVALHKSLRIHVFAEPSILIGEPIST